jgi:alkylation response protein AidB-like acyl-CoA dehydrogenase
MTSTAEQASREAAEAARETQWRERSFLRDIFLGKFRFDLVRAHPASMLDGAMDGATDGATDGSGHRPAFRRFYTALEEFLRTRVDPVIIDESGEYPPDVVRGLAEIGAFGMKIPEEYGGLGLSNYEYARAMMLLGSRDANLTALLSAHQSIGVPQPLELYGTEDQKRRYLPRCAKGTISAFALTEPAVGSDPARITSTAELTPDGKHYRLNGTKLWCTNGTIAEVIVVMARTLPQGGISAFIVESSWPGFVVKHRCRFMGLKALANAVLEFHDVLVPRENLLGREGKGLSVALATLNTGRLALPAATAGGAKACLEISRKWSSARVQWGRPVGRHESISHMLADMAASVFAMESVVDVTTEMADREGYDIRLEAAAAKEWNTVRAWHILDDTLEIRGGRGYERESSLAARGEFPIGVERMMRDSRVNRIFEGSSEIMHLFMAREAVDKHLQVAGALINPKSTTKQRLAALVRAFAFYAVWYPMLWIGWDLWPRFSGYGRLAPHLRFVRRSSRKLARSLFHGMLVYRAGLEKRQAFLFRAVDVAMELFVMASAIAHARALKARGGDAVATHHGNPDNPATPPAATGDPVEMAELVCHNGRRVVAARFHALWHNDDRLKGRVGRDVLDGTMRWLEDGAIGIGADAEQLRPAAQERSPAELPPERGRTPEAQKPPGTEHPPV